MSTRFAYLPGACVAVMAIASVAMASTFDNLRTGQITPIAAGDALLTEGTPPTSVASKAAMGLVPGDEIDALSFGDDWGMLRDTERIVFSVDVAAVGLGGTGVDFEVLIGTPPRTPDAVGDPPEASGDIFVHTFNCSNALAQSGLGYLLGVVISGGDESNGEWMTPNVALAADDLDAFDYSDANAPNDIPDGVYFSLAAGSPSLGAAGFTAGTIFFSKVDGTPFSIATLEGVGPATDVELGIGGEDLDALNVVGDNTGVIQAGFVFNSPGCTNVATTSTHAVQYSVATAGAFAPGDVLVRTAAGTAEVYVSFADLGLTATDNLNALEVIYVPHDAPAVSEWGVAVLALLVLLSGTIVVRRQRRVVVV